MAAVCVLKTIRDLFSAPVAPTGHLEGTRHEPGDLTFLIQENNAVCQRLPSVCYQGVTYSVYRTIGVIRADVFMLGDQGGPVCVGALGRLPVEQRSQTDASGCF